MKKLLSVFLAGAMSLGLVGCTISLPEKEVLLSPQTIDLTPIVIEKAHEWIGDYETDICLGDYIYDLEIPIEKNETEITIKEEDYEAFEQKTVQELVDLVEVMVSDSLFNIDYDEEKAGYTTREFAEKVLCMSLEDYVKGYMQEAIPSQDYIEGAYGANIESSASIEGNGAVMVAREDEYLVNLELSIDGNEPVKVKGLTYFYDNNYMISMRDLACLLNPTGKFFNVDIVKKEVAITKNCPYMPLDLECQGFDEEDEGALKNAILKGNGLTINGEDAKYYSILLIDGDYSDVYMRLIDVAMILDLDITKSGPKTFAINTDSHFSVNMEELREIEFFDSINAALVGDGATGELYFANDEDTAYAIASITKVMNYIVAKDQVAMGKISDIDLVPFSANAVKIARSDDGVLDINLGQKTQLQELYVGMLLPSSNECALAVAEYIAGSEDAYVEMMNEKARELGLESAKFYTCHGLPTYTDTVPARKIQNEMSARDMFKMITYLLNTYPEVEEITSQKTIMLPMLNCEVKSTNPLVYNMTGITGLKSGTTNRSGACQTASTNYRDSMGNDHKIVAIELGAEGGQDKQTYIEILIRAGLQIAEEDSGIEISSMRDIPDDFEDLILLLKTKAKRLPITE